MRRSRKIVVAAAVLALVGAAVLGRLLLTTGAPHAGAPQAGAPSVPAGAAHGTTEGATPGNAPLAVPRTGTGETPGTATKRGAGPSSSTRSSSGTASAEPASASGALPPVPVFPVAPQVVRTATVNLHVRSGAVRNVLTDISGLAAADGGYVESSGMSGGTATSAPASGTIVIHVVEGDFSTAIAHLARYGSVTAEHVSGKDVTDQVAANAASLEVLQREVALLQGKLAQATEITTFLQIEQQLFPVEQQLQQLQNQQAVLENSAAMATITVGIAAPGAPAPAGHRAADAAARAWQYLRHNTLAVLDGLAVAGGWLLPVLVLLAVLGALGVAGTRLWRHRRRAVTPV